MWSTPILVLLLSNPIGSKIWPIIWDNFPLDNLKSKSRLAGPMSSIDTFLGDGC